MIPRVVLVRLGLIFEENFWMQVLLEVFAFSIILLPRSWKNTSEDCAKNLTVNAKREIISSLKETR